jgi:plastocyanin
MTRSRVALVAGSAALIVAVAPALAAQDHTITASRNVFTDADITIAVGDRVLFGNNGGVHNFAFED